MPEAIKDFSFSDGIERYGPILDQLKQQYVERGLPLRGSFELTPHCTLDCKMCYVHNSNGVYSSPVMSGDEWISIMDEAIDAGMLMATLTGGECFFHPDFKRIYEHLKRRGVYVSLLTNATLIDEEAVKWLKKYPPQSMRISVYGCSPEGYERVTGSRNAFYRVDKVLSLLKEAGIPADIEITVSRYNFDDFANILTYAKSKAVGQVGFDCHLFRSYDDAGKEISDYVLSTEEMAEVYRTVVRLNNHLCDPITEADYNISSVGGEPIRTPANYPNTMPCSAGMWGFMIGYDGYIQPCTQFPLGRSNVRELGFMNAWKRVNTAAKEYVRSIECMSCKYYGSCRFCPAQYYLSSCDANDVPGMVPCNKNSLILHMVVDEKTYQAENVVKGDSYEKEI